MHRLEEQGRAHDHAGMDCTCWLPEHRWSCLKGSAATGLEIAWCFVGKACERMGDVSRCCWLEIETDLNNWNRKMGKRTFGDARYSEKCNREKPAGIRR